MCLKSVEWYQRRILLSVTGLTPQVVTETLYALHQLDVGLMPNEVHLLSTKEGIERARLTLLSERPGWFRRFLDEYGIDHIHFTESNLHVMQGIDSVPLKDIRTPEDNEIAANAITNLIRCFTEDDCSQLHVSLAGGRKTMGYYAGYALSLFGREQDRLSHVLVDGPFESHPEFYYPTLTPHIIYAQGDDKRPLDTALAEVALAEIPFVRLRHGLPKTLLNGKTSFSQAVHAAQQGLGPSHLRFDSAARKVYAGEQIVNLAPVDLAFYLWLAKRAAKGDAPVGCPPEGVPSQDYATAFLAEYRRIIQPFGDDDRVSVALSRGMEKGYFLSRKSRINKTLQQTLGVLATPYLIEAIGRRPSTCFGLRLGPDQISFEDDQP